MMTRKSPLEKRRPIFFQTGLIAALALALVAFQWTSVELSKGPVSIDLLESTDISEITPISPIPQAPPKPFTPIIQSHQINEVDDDFSDQKDEKKPVFLPIADFGDLGDGDEGDDGYDYEEPITFTVVDASKVRRAPRYESCINAADPMVELQCTRNAIIEYVQQIAVYPWKEKEAGMSGSATIAFVIDSDGSITNVKVLRQDTKGFGDAAANAVRKLPALLPALHFDRPVAVNFQIPVRFQMYN